MTLLGVSEFLFHQQPKWHLKPNLEQTVLWVKGTEEEARALSLVSILMGPPAKLRFSRQSEEHAVSSSKKRAVPPLTGHP